MAITCILIDYPFSDDDYEYNQYYGVDRNASDDLDYGYYFMIYDDSRFESNAPEYGDNIYCVCELHRYTTPYTRCCCTGTVYYILL
jgi:hypothetical protein